MLSSILRFKISITKNINAPLNPIITICEIVKDLYSNNHKTKILIPKDTKNPERYPIKVLFEDFGM